jgi:glyoxylase-like metal-dependent hydrolase (beta-lactamase superfamily II)
MKVSTYGKYLVQLTYMRIANCFLVRDDNGLTLIDTLVSGQADAILEAAHDLNAPIVRIGITHAHTDHVGALDELVAALPGVEIGIGVREVELLDGSPLKARPTLLLHDGCGFGSLQVVATPGHTPGHVAFYDPRDGTLIVGDALQTVGGIAVVGWPRPVFPFPSLATWHRPTALDSARRMRELNPLRIAAGHGPVVESPVEALDLAIARAEGSQR